MRSLRPWWGLLAATVLVLGACGGDDSAESNGGGEPSSAAESSETESESSESETETETDAESDPESSGIALDGPPTPAQLRKALLPLSAMPTGWQPLSYQPLSEEDVCPVHLAGRLGLGKEPAAEGVMYTGSFTTGVSESIQAVPGRGSELLAVVRKTFAACDGQPYDGSPLRVSPRKSPTFGDASATYTVIQDDTPVSVAAVASGDVLIIFAAFDMSGDPVQLLQTYVPQAIDRADRVLG